MLLQNFAYVGQIKFCSIKFSAFRIVRGEVTRLYAFVLRRASVHAQKEGNAVSGERGVLHQSFGVKLTKNNNKELASVAKVGQVSHAFLNMLTICP